MCSCARRPTVDRHDRRAHADVRRDDVAISRWQRYNRAATVSTPSDWTFLFLLWMTGLTGFLIEVALYAPPTPAWGYWVFLVHVAIAMELLLFIPFTKFAHVIYRPVALFFYSLADQKSTQAA